MRKVRIPKLYGRKPFSKAAYGKDWSAVSKSTIERAGNKCVDCGGTKKLQAHHIIPLSKGGTNTNFNLIALCEACHAKRHRHLK